MVTGGRQPIQGNPYFDIAYEMGKIFAKNKYQLLTGIAKGVDENFAREAYEAVSNNGEDIRDYLKAYTGKNQRPHHTYWKILVSKFRKREEGIPELVEECDLIFLLSGAKNTSYIGVLSLLENKIVLPLSVTGGAASDLYSLILNRYDKVYGNLLPKSKFQNLADIGRTPIEMAEVCFDLVKIISGHS